MNGGIQGIGGVGGEGMVSTHSRAGAGPIEVRCIREDSKEHRRGENDLGSIGVLGTIAEKPFHGGHSI